MPHKQEQFLDVIDRDEAERRFAAALDLAPLGTEKLPLDAALGRVLAEDVPALVDVPSFDRSNFDGFAVRAADTFGANEQHPLRLKLLDTAIPTGVVPECEVFAGTAVAIATGGMLPRGADAVVMIEHTDATDGELLVRRAVTSGQGLSFAGSDIAAGELVLHAGQLLSSRETGVLAAIGTADVPVYRRPRVAIISTGDEIVDPAQDMRPGLVYDSNGRILGDAVRELGAEPVMCGIVCDDPDLLRERVRDAIQNSDVVLLSGGTSKGEGDICYRVVAELTEPGIVAHGVALKPGKPICLATHHGKPVVILPGFPTSAIFTFHEFVAPVICRLAGQSPGQRATTHARLAVKVNSEIGRTEFLLVGLIRAAETDSSGSDLVAYPMGSGSGSVTTFSRADGFVVIGRHEEIVEAGAEVEIHLLSPQLHVADLVVIGSHCVGLDYLLGLLQKRGNQIKFMAVGSTAGLEAARRGECDLAGIHLLDTESGQYNRPYVTARLELIPGYGRRLGIVYRRGDQRFEGRPAGDAINGVKDDPNVMMINRNQGSGTRIVIDQLLDGSRPDGYAVQCRSHNAVAAAVEQCRADWGVAIESVARQSGLDFSPLQDEQFDFVVPHSHANRPAVLAFRELLSDEAVRERLQSLGFRLPADRRL